MGKEEEEAPESLFAKELRRRGMEPGSAPSGEKAGAAEAEQGGRGGEAGRKRGVAAAAEFEKAAVGADGKRERSMALNGEGLERNKWDFFVFLCMGTTTSFLGAAIGFHRLRTEPIILTSSESWTHFMVTKHPGAVLFMFMDVFLLTQIARNLTTNEAANQSRYAYLRGPDGRFRNPYNLGCQRNCAYFLVNGYSNDEEAAWPTLQQTVQRS